MSIRRFCDQCGTEISEASGWGTDARICDKTSRLMVEVTTGWDGSWNSGDLCKPCIVNAVLAAAGFGISIGEPL